MSPKSVRGDGTAKKRWSSAERASRGHNPRRRGGVPRSRTEDRPARERRAESPVAAAPKAAYVQRDARPARKPHTRPDRAEWPSRSARDNSKRGYTRSAPVTGDSRVARETWTRDDRPDRADRPNRAPRVERPERDQPVRFERRDQPKRFERRDQPARFERRRPARAHRASGPTATIRASGPTERSRDRTAERVERQDRQEKVQRDRPERIERVTPPPVVREQTGDFAGLGVPPSLGRRASRRGHHQPVPDPGRRHPRRTRRARRARPRTDRLRQDARLRPADDHHPGRRRVLAAPRHRAGADP